MAAAIQEPGSADLQKSNPQIEKTVVGWQGITCELPPDWNVTGFSMDRESGYLRIDSPGNGTVTVQIRWTNAAKPAKTQTSLYTMLAPQFRKIFRQPEPVVPETDLKANLEKVLKDTAKLAKKAKTSFESSIKAEKIEGVNEERTSINFSWTGAGKGQGKIWRCRTCNRVVVAQVVGMGKDQNSISAVAAQLFATMKDHSDDGYELWGLYDLKLYIPNDFRLESQKLLSGHLHLSFIRQAEKIVFDRWGLANMTRKKFTLVEWFKNTSLTSLKRLQQSEIEISSGHQAVKYSGALSLIARLQTLKESRSFRRFPTRYTGGVWECTETNKIFALQVCHSKKTQELWEEVANRCSCHSQPELS